MLQTPPIEKFLARLGASLDANTFVKLTLSQSPSDESGLRNVYARVFLRDFFLFFARLPYSIYQIMPRRLAAVSTYDHRFENLQYKNFVALHDSVRS